MKQEMLNNIVYISELLCGIFSGIWQCKMICNNVVNVYKVNERKFSERM